MASNQLQCLFSKVKYYQMESLNSGLVQCIALQQYFQSSKSGSEGSNEYNKIRKEPFLFDWLNPNFFLELGFFTILKRLHKKYYAQATDGRSAEKKALFGIVVEGSAWGFSKCQRRERYLSETIFEDI